LFFSPIRARRCWVIFPPTAPRSALRSLRPSLVSALAHAQAAFTGQSIACSFPFGHWASSSQKKLRARDAKLFCGFLRAGLCSRVRVHNFRQRTKQAFLRTSPFSPTKCFSRASRFTA